MYFSVVIPTFNRPESLSKCLEKLLNCDPLPQEILVHVDAGDLTTEPKLKPIFGDQVTWLHSKTNQGPGGGRNKLIKAAKYPIIASFDDDSWPISPNYFQVALDTFTRYPQAAVISAQEIRRNIHNQSKSDRIQEVSCFQNCACLIRKEAFMQTSGYIPLRYAYGMEEADVALQILDKGWQIIEVPDLQVFHDTQLEHHQTVAITSSHISNTALLAYLRYPITAWPLGMLQVLNRVRYAASVGRWRGIPQGIWQIPYVIWRYRHYRQPIRSDTLKLSRQIAHRRD